jgi:alpha,alpha-trehalose phosphorylase
LRRRQPELLPSQVYPVDEWRLVERRFSRKLLPRVETLFALANGYLGMRGNHEEGRPAHEHGTFIAGFHETWPIVHAEEAFGLAKTGQTIVNVPDAQLIKLYVDDEPLFLPTAHLSSYERILDMREGVLYRSLVWETASGKQVRVRSRRLISLRHRHLAAFQYEVTVLNADAPIVISSQLLNREDADAPDEPHMKVDPRTSRSFADRVLEQRLKRVEDARLILGYRTTSSRMTLACGVDHVIETGNDYQLASDATEDLGKVVYIIEAQAGEPVSLTKYATYHTSRNVPARELVDRASRVLRRAVDLGIDSLVATQRELVGQFWDRCDVVVADQPEIQQAVRWNLFQLMQASERAEGEGIPAKGLTGSGYEGHYFWDIEIFVLPFLSYTEPRIAKNLLRFRHSMLPKACDRARELSHVGALYPWRTITGDEASAYYAAGTAQYHLNADIAFAIKRHVDITADLELLADGGAEILLQTARLWEDLGFYDDDGVFHLHSVTGPDEYTTVVNDNAYTNLMARQNLRYAADVLDLMQEAEPDRYRMLCRDAHLQPDEPAAWRRAADAMYVPYDEKRGVHPQDAHFLEREVWDFEGTPPEKYPLLLHYHPLVIYRHQVIKQADVILAMFLLGDEFSHEQKARNFAYYDPLTTSDSSLSPPVHAIAAAEIGEAAAALDHFRLALFMDLADVGANVDHGVHVASAGGVWQALVSGFGGLRDYDGQVSFDPRLPREWTGLSFPLQVRGQRFDVEITHEEIAFRLRDGEGLEVTVRGTDVTLVAGERVALPLEEDADA